MSKSALGPIDEEQRVLALTSAVECLEGVDRQVAERIDPACLQDIVGNLLLILATLDAAKVNGAAPVLVMRDVRTLARECLARAGMTADESDQAVIATLKIVQGVGLPIGGTVDPNSTGAVANVLRLDARRPSPRRVE